MYEFGEQQDTVYVCELEHSKETWDGQLPLTNGDMGLCLVAGYLHSCRYGCKIHKQLTYKEVNVCPLEVLLHKLMQIQVCLNGFASISLCGWCCINLIYHFIYFNTHVSVSEVQ